MKNRTKLRENLPLTETTFFILLSLAPGPSHGYAILKGVRELSDGRVVLSTGTLYGALRRLLEQGWIEHYEGPEQDEIGRSRKDYRLTGMGLRIIDLETGRLRELLQAAHLQRAREIAK